MRHKIQRKRVIIQDEDVPLRARGPEWDKVMRAVSGRHFPRLKKHGAAWTFPSQHLDAFTRLMSPFDVNPDAPAAETDQNSTDGPAAETGNGGRVDAEAQTDGFVAQTEKDDRAGGTRYKHDVDKEVCLFVADWLRQTGLADVFPVCV